MPDTASLLGIPTEFTFRDKVYQVAPRTLELEGMFARWVSGGALEFIQAHQEQMTPQFFQGQFDGWRHDGASHLYDWGTWICSQAANSEAGRKRLALLQLAKLNKGVTAATVEQIANDPAKWTELLLKMKEASGEADPRQSAEASETLGPAA